MRITRRKTLAIMVLIWTALIARIWAQNLYDLYDPIYEDMRGWIGAGYLEPMPSLQPWTPQQVSAALNRMLADPGLPEAVRNEAETYLDALGPGGKALSVHLFADTRHSFGDEAEHHTELGPGLNINWRISDLVHLQVSGNPTFVDYQDGDALVYGERTGIDWIPDWSDIDIGDRNIRIQTRLLSQLALGTGEFSAFSGFGRTNWGLGIDESVILSRTAPFGAYFGFTWNAEAFDFSFLYRPLTATNNQGSSKSPDKHLVFHALEWHPARWLELSFYETLIWGNRFDLTYFVPFSSLFLSQGIGSFDGNSLLGVGAVFKPFAGLRVPVTVYADDVHFNDIMRLNFDTKYKLAFQAGVEWYPSAQGVQVLQSVALGYAAAMPYMYTHWDEQPQRAEEDTDSWDTWMNSSNYSNYTHLGKNLAGELEPNSDRLSLTIRAEPISALGLELSLRQYRHGNASAGILDNPSGTGSIFDPGYDGKNPTFQDPYDDPTGQPYTRFLTQDVIQTVRQVGIEADLGLGDLLDWVDLRLSIGYVFEHTVNAEFVEGNSENKHFVSFFLDAEF